MRPGFLRGSGVVSAGVGFDFAGQVLRTLILTRLLGPTEFGIAVSLSLVSSLIDMGTGIGADRFLIHAPDGGRRRPLAVAHTLQLLRGVLGAALTAALAWPTAHLLNVPDAAGSFLFLAALPLLRSLAHLRVMQMQRQHWFLPDAGATIIGNAAGLATALLAAWVLRDHRAVLWSLTCYQLVYVAITHLRSRVPYRLSVDADGLRRAIGFGLPLMLNGLALAALGQVDRLAAGSFLGVTVLGQYSLALTLLIMPTSLVFRVAITLLQPRLSAAWHRGPRDAFPTLFRQCCTLAAGLALLAGVGAAALGNPVVMLVFGPAYGSGDLVFVILGGAVFVRFARSTANLAGLAMGRTRDLMLSNLAGGIGIVTGIGLLLVSARIESAAIGLLAGELAGTAVAYAMLRADLVNAADAAKGFLVLLPVLAASCLWMLLAPPGLLARAAMAAVVAAGVLTMLRHQRLPALRQPA